MTPLLPAVVLALREADRKGLLWRGGETSLAGFSGHKLIGALQRLATLLPVAEDCYLEIGVFQGLSLLSVAGSNPLLPCFGIDNFSQFDHRGRNREILAQRQAALQLGNALLIDRDYEEALINLPLFVGGAKIGLLFVDGPHDYRSQRMAVELALPYLATNALIVVDDANYRHVRLATRDLLLVHPELNLLFEAYTPAHPSNLPRVERLSAQVGWWNGVHVLMRLPEGSLAPHFPPTDTDRKLFENDHLIHGSNLAELAPAAIDLLQLLFSGPSLRSIGRSVRSVRDLVCHRWRLLRQPRFRSVNTYSRGLPGWRLHPGL